jgi:hypothetical protein
VSKEQSDDLGGSPWRCNSDHERRDLIQESAMI